MYQEADLVGTVGSKRMKLFYTTVLLQIPPPTAVCYRKAYSNYLRKNYEINVVYVLETPIMLILVPSMLTLLIPLTYNLGLEGAEHVYPAFEK